MAKKRIVLIDGNSLMFRAYFATAYTGNLMKTSTGIYTNAIYGFYLMVNNIFKEEEYTFVAFDAGKETFRHRAYKDYKGTRKPMAEELREQIPYIKNYLDILKINRLESMDVEADDLLATVATKYYDQFDEVVIISGDKDLLQLVNDKVTVKIPTRGTSEFDEFTKENFYEKMGIYPNQVTDYKGMVGDSSDNLPGIKGIGDKTAVKLLNEYKTLENVIANVAELKGKMQENFINDKDQGLKSKELATLKHDVDLNYVVEDFKIKDYSEPELIKFLEELEFNSFLKDLHKVEKPKTKIDFEIITDSKYNFTNVLTEDGYLNFEVFGKNYYSGEFLGFSFVSSKYNLFITKEVLLNNKEVQEYLSSNKFKKKVFDYKMISLVLGKYNLEINNVVFDLEIAAYLINPNYGVGDFKQVLANFKTNLLPYYDNVYGANKKMEIPSIEVYSKYSVEKSIELKDIEDHVLSRLDEYDLGFLYNIEMELSRVLSKLELIGLKIDNHRLDEISIDLNSRIKIIEEEIIKIAGVDFNINSPKQLGEVLFEKLGYPHGKKTKTGYSTNVEVLEWLAAKGFPIAKLVLEYRGLNKLITTYVNGLREAQDSNAFVHPLYRQTETQTGRLSSIEPNIQNIPTRTEEGQVIRELFISRFTDGVIVSADYSQIELRVLAHLADDPVMINAFNQDVDFHSLTASRLYEVNIEYVTKEMRRVSKAINFGIIYGMSAWGLSETINITPIEANIYINKYFATYPKTKEFLDSLVRNVKAEGYTKTILNRRRYIPEATSSNQNLRSFGERTAMNAPIQGSAADIIKIAMVNLNKKMEDEGLKSLMIAQIHDELLFDCVPEEVAVMKKIIKEEMEKAYKLKVKLDVEVNAGENWAKT